MIGYAAQSPITRVILSGAVGGVEESVFLKKKLCNYGIFGMRILCLAVLAQDDTDIWSLVRLNDHFRANLYFSKKICYHRPEKEAMA